MASGPHVGPEASDRKPAERRWERREPRAGSGRFNSALFATVTTDTSCGAVNAMHDSFTPLGGMVPLVNIQLGDSMLSIHSGCTGTRHAPGTWSLW